MRRGPADEAIVIVKPGAEEPVVTRGRGKHRVSDGRLEVKGGTRKRSMRGVKDWGSETRREEPTDTCDVDSGRTDGAGLLKGPCTREG